MSKTTKRPVTNKAETATKQEQKQQPETKKQTTTTTETNKTIVNKQPESSQPKEEKTKQQVKPKTINAKTLDGALENLKDNSKVKDLVIGVKNYVNTLRSNPNPHDYVNANYRFYKLIVDQLDTPDYGLFKTRFETLLKLFKLGHNDVLNPITVLKYDHFWKFGGRSRAAYGFIITFIDAVKEPKNRRKELKRINFKTFGDYVPANIVRNLQRYFNI